ncbi:hypothetical protein AM593_08088, partial [Mytilus galloprovincialis]
MVGMAAIYFAFTKCYETYTQCLMPQHIMCVTLSASPNYVSAFVDIKLYCKINEYIANAALVSFGRNSSIIGSVKCSRLYRNIRKYFPGQENFESCNFGDGYCCDSMNNTVTWTYTPESTPNNNETFYCEVKGYNGQYSNSITVRPAVLSSVIVSPSFTEYKITQGDTVENITNE